MAGPARALGHPRREPRRLLRARGARGGRGARPLARAARHRVLRRAHDVLGLRGAVGAQRPPSGSRLRRGVGGGLPGDGDPRAPARRRPSPSVGPCPISCSATCGWCRCAETPRHPGRWTCGSPTDRWPRWAWRWSALPGWTSTTRTAAGWSPACGTSTCTSGSGRSPRPGWTSPAPARSRRRWAGSRTASPRGLTSLSSAGATARRRGTASRPFGSSTRSPAYDRWC